MRTLQPMNALRCNLAVRPLRAWVAGLQCASCSLAVLLVRGVEARGDGQVALRRAVLQCDALRCDVLQCAALRSVFWTDA